jgi:hypothetical protein
MKPEKGKKKEKPVQPVQKQTSSTNGPFFKSMLLNLIGGVLAATFIYFLFAPWTAGMEDAEATKILESSKPNIDGYYWLYNQMLANNLKTIAKYPDLTFAQRYEAKSAEIGAISRIKQQTPDSAIIIIPPRKILAQAKLTSAEELPWLTYFVYPRKVVYEDDKDSSKLYSHANYIMELNGWGFDKLNYTVERPEALMILPLKK